MKQPDAFAKAVEREYQKWLKGPQEKGWLSIADRLIRAHHKNVVRMVQRMKPDILKNHWYAQACDEILAKLKAMEGEVMTREWAHAVFTGIWKGIFIGCVSGLFGGWQHNLAAGLWFMLVFSYWMETRA